jgi:hypothetical protein
MKLALIVGAIVACPNAALAGHAAEAPSVGRDAGSSAATPSDSDARVAGRASGISTDSPGYPVDMSTPKDFFTDRLLRTLAREASATVVCRLLGLVDAFPQQKDPDVFYDASCEVLEVIAGRPNNQTLHFIWQVERGNRMPPPQSELLVYLKARKEPLDGPPLLKWVALDTGVLRYTPALKERIHHFSK